jgi:enterochelin esterase family protein
VLPLRKNESGTWTVTVGPFNPGSYTYRFSVDGVAVDDPNNPAKPATTLTIPDTGPLFDELRPVPHGVAQQRSYESKSLALTRRITVYTPPDYEKSANRYPVVYMFPGAGGDETQWTGNGRAHLIFDNLIAEGKLKPLIAVMPVGNAYPAAAPQVAGAADAMARQRAGFNRDLIEDLIPYVEANYRVIADRDHRAIVGMSLGGAQALGVGLTRLDLFSRVVAIAPALGGVTSAQAGALDFNQVLADSKKVNSSVKLLWIGVGTDDTLLSSILAFDRQLTMLGIQHTFRTDEGYPHGYLIGRRYLYDVAPLLFP